MTLYEMLNNSALKHPDKVAICEEDGKTVTYLELKRRVDNFQQYLFKLGILHNMNVGILMHNSISFAIILYSLSKNGNTVCLLNPRWSIDIVFNKCFEANTENVFVEQYLFSEMDMNNSSNNNVLRIYTSDVVDKFDNGEYVVFNERVGFDCNSNVLIQSSSGTTGYSKMAYRTNINIEMDTQNIINNLSYDSRDIVYCPVPLCHGYGLTMGLIAPICCGATIILERWFKANSFIERYDIVKPTIFIGIPEIYNILSTTLREKNILFKNYKWFFCSGDILERKIAESFFEVSGIWINQVYGMMEASTISVNKRPNRKTVTSVGRPFPEITYQLLEHESNKYAILIKSDTVSLNYVSSNEKKVICDKHGWFNTKDLCELDNEGNLYLQGRKDVD